MINNISNSHIFSCSLFQILRFLRSLRPYAREERNILFGAYRIQALLSLSCLVMSQRPSYFTIPREVLILFCWLLYVSEPVYDRLEILLCLGCKVVSNLFV
jgi:hypothetical protein